MKTAIAQMDIKWEDKAENKKRAEEMTAAAAEKKADFIIFPEMTLTGFSFNTQRLAEEWEGSQTIAFFADISKKYKIHISFGMILKKNGGCYNKCLTVNKDGIITADYSKIHPFSYSGEDKFFLKGSKTVVYKAENINIAPFVCYDLRFPEIFRINSEKTEVITVIASWPESRRAHWLSLLKARAIENQCYVIGVNRTGNGGGIKYSGDSAVFDYNGDLRLDCGNTAGVYFFDIDKKRLKEYRESFPVLKDIRIIK